MKLCTLMKPALHCWNVSIEKNRASRLEVISYLAIVGYNAWILIK